jgi:sugar-specific transcriptional regulator TrmB
MEELNFLRKLGFTEYESRIYSSIVQLGVASAREITDISKIPKNKVYETIKRLLLKNLILELPITPKKYKSNDIEKLQNIIDEKKNEVKKLEKDIENFKKIQNKQEFKEFFWVIKGQKNIQEKLNYLDKEAEKEILTINQISKFLPKNIRSIKKLVEQDIKVKMICMLDQTNHKIVKDWVKTGAEIRVFNKELYGDVIPKFTVYDKKLRITIGKPEIQDSNEYISLIVESPSMIKIFRNQFMSMWKNSLDVNKELGSDLFLREKDMFLRT